MACVPGLSAENAPPVAARASCSQDSGACANRSSYSGSSSRNPGSTEIRPQILRGASISNLLQSCGKHLRTSPIDLPMAAREALWAKSKECTELDVFISQSWTSPGWQKYLALLVHFYWVPAVVVSVSSTIVFVILDGYNLLPTLKAHRTDRIGWDSEVHISPWCAIPPTLGLVALFLGPSIPLLPNRLVFFDALCINQADQEMMLEGIYSLSGFVANSKKLLILWGQSYFRRAWCVLELAVFVSIHGHSAIVFSPLFATTTQVTVFVTCTIWIGYITALDCLTFLGSYSMMYWLGRSLVFAILVFSVDRFRRQLTGVRDLMGEFDHFDLNALRCRVDSDLDFIKQSVEALYGSDDFNMYVQQTLKTSVQVSASNFDFQYSQCLMMAFPAVPYGAQQLMASARAGLSGAEIISAVAGYATMYLFISTATVKVLYILCHRYAQRRQSFLVDFLYSIGIALLAFLLQTLGYVGSVAMDNLPLGGWLVFAAGTVWSGVSFNSKRIRGCFRELLPLLAALIRGQQTSTASHTGLGRPAYASPCPRTIGNMDSFLSTTN